MPEPSELWRRIARVGDLIDPRLSDRDVERQKNALRPITTSASA